MDFEWDAGKRATNILKHGLYFEEAWKIFEGLYFSMQDSRRDYGETRYVTIGMLNGRTVVLVHTQRSGTHRIISMRKANDREKKRYQQRLVTIGRHD